MKWGYWNYWRWTKHALANKCSSQIHQILIYSFYCITSFNPLNMQCYRVHTWCSSLPISPVYLWIIVTRNTSKPFYWVCKWFTAIVWWYWHKKNICQRVIWDFDSINLWCHDEKEVTSFVVTSTMGIGKTYYLHYFLWVLFTRPTNINNNVERKIYL